MKEEEEEWPNCGDCEFYVRPLMCYWHLVMQAFLIKEDIDRQVLEMLYEEEGL